MVDQAHLSAPAILHQPEQVLAPDLCIRSNRLPELIANHCDRMAVIIPERNVQQHRPAGIQLAANLMCRQAENRSGLPAHPESAKQGTDNGADAQRIGPAPFGPVAMPGSQGFDLVKEQTFISWQQGDFLTFLDQ